MRQKQTENEGQIRLKPIMGIRPGVYLTVLYAFILLVILFFLLVYPGLKNPGAVLIVKTEPAGAAIRVNDVYMGVSGSKIFVPKGTHTIEAVMPGFESQNAVHEIPGRIFGSRFFPFRYRTEFTLRTNDPAAAFAHYAADFAAWTFAGEPTATWQVPLSLSEGAYRTGPFTGTQETMAELQDILAGAACFTVTRAALRDLIRAKILLDNNGNAPCAAALIGSISDVLAFLSENPGSASWLYDLLPSEAGTIIRGSNWYQNEYLRSERPASAAQAAEQRILGQLNLAGIAFSGFPNRFMISENPVSQSVFETFLDENPQWREHKTDYFPEEISFNPMDTYRRNAVTGITWYAAQAFCKWLTEQLPAPMAGMEVRLPSEAEWEYAALYISNMNNPGWEWCADPYAPLQFITASPEAIEVFGSPERSLRGTPSLASTETRASLQPGLSSPIVTFRPVIAERK